MKYIRTKDYIHDSKDVVVVNENGTLVVVRGIDKDFIERNRGRTWNTGTNVVLAQADTIKELCDEFVSINKESKNHSLIEIEKGGNRYTKDKITHWIETLENKLKRFEIYGSIWVDGELHKVAKMNEKGKLELL